MRKSSINIIGDNLSPILNTSTHIKKGTIKTIILSFLILIVYLCFLNYSYSFKSNNKDKDRDFIISELNNSIIKYQNNINVALTDVNKIKDEILVNKMQIDRRLSSIDLVQKNVKKYDELKYSDFINLFNIIHKDLEKDSINLSSISYVNGYFNLELLIKQQGALDNLKKYNYIINAIDYESGYFIVDMSIRI